jgi:hypothetical protein
MSLALADLLESNMLNPILAKHWPAQPDRTCLFWSPPRSEDLLRAIDDHFSILVEGKSVEKLRNFGSNPGDFVIIISSLSAYYLDMFQVLDHYFYKNTDIPPVITEQIITATYEAFSNALIWSNLEIVPPQNGEKDFDFLNTIEKSLSHQRFARRPLKLQFWFFPKSVDVSITSYGLPFNLEQALQSNTKEYKGLAIMHTLSTRLWSEEEGRRIWMRFDI